MQTTFCKSQTMGRTRYVGEDKILQQTLQKNKTNYSMTHVLLIYPHQLFRAENISADISVFYLIEDPLFFTQFKFHKKKLVLHRASMKYYQAYLESLGYQTKYIDSAKLAESQDILKILEKDKVKQVSFFDLTDDWLERFLTEGLDKSEISYMVIESPSFICSREYVTDYFLRHKEKKTRPLLLDFYKQLRIKHGILVDQGRPKGGMWSLDAENRKKLPKGMQVPTPYQSDKTTYTEEAIEYVNKNFADHYGSTDDFVYAVTHDDALDALDHFIKHCLYNFGPYEDAVVESQNILFHSVLTPYLNNGLLTPNEVLKKVLEHSEHYEIPLESLEGFVRQVLGWREYMRGVYLVYGRSMRTSNIFKADNKLPESFWNATTGIVPIDDSIRKTIDTAYLHHIPRLMIMGNFMNLCAIHPDEVYKWFMELFIDAYDWVMVPNVYAMALYADGGSITTKPYISGSNYIVKMSDYKKGTWSEIWDALFWNFVSKHNERLSSEGRMHFVMSIWSKKTDEERKLIQEEAAKYKDEMFHKESKES